MKARFVTLDIFCQLLFCSSVFYELVSPWLTCSVLTTLDKSNLKDGNTYIVTNSFVYHAYHSRFYKKKITSSCFDEWRCSHMDFMYCMNNIGMGSIDALVYISACICICFDIISQTFFVNCYCNEYCLFYHNKCITLCKNFNSCIRPIIEMNTNWIMKDMHL